MVELLLLSEFTLVFHQSSRKFCLLQVHMSDSGIEGPASAETACDSLHLWHQAVATLAAVVLVLCAARLADRKRVAAAREEVYWCELFAKK